MKGYDLALPKDGSLKQRILCLFNWFRSYSKIASKGGVGGLKQCTNSGVVSPYTEVIEFVYLSPVTVTGSLYYPGYFNSINALVAGRWGDQRFSTPLNRGDHPFMDHLHWGYQWKDAGKFAQFSRPPAPVVNDISLSKYGPYISCFECMHSNGWWPIFLMITV